MEYDFFWNIWEYLALRTQQEGQAPSHEGGGRALPPGRAPCLVGPRWPSSTYSCTHTLLLPPTNTNIQFIPEAKLVLLPFSISLLKAPFTKVLWGIVLRYVTPPMVQLVFVLVLYSLHIFAAQVTLFLSLHVKFMWFQVVLLHAPLGTCGSSCYQSCWVWFTFILSY